MNIEETRESMQRRIEAAESDREAYRLEAERERALRVKMEGERDALAAHVERISSCRLESGRIGIWSLNNALKETPATSLARRDLLKQAGELDDLAAELTKHGHSDAAQTARIRAHVKRQRAQELGQ